MGIDPTQKRPRYIDEDEAEERGETERRVRNEMKRRDKQ